MQPTWPTCNPAGTGPARWRALELKPGSRVCAAHGRRCADCGRSDVPLEVHHVNADPTDNRIQNTIPLCGIATTRRRSPTCDGRSPVDETAMADRDPLHASPPCARVLPAATHRGLEGDALMRTRIKALVAIVIASAALGGSVAAQASADPPLYDYFFSCVAVGFNVTASRRQRHLEGGSPGSGTTPSVCRGGRWHVYVHNHQGVVHHRNADPTDNRIRNTIPLCRDCHRKATFSGI